MNNAYPIKKIIINVYINYGFNELIGLKYCARLLSRYEEKENLLEFFKFIFIIFVQENRVFFLLL